MDDSFSVIEIIEEDEPEELTEAVEPGEMFEYCSIPENMAAVEEIEIKSKSARVSEEGSEDPHVPP